MRRGSEKSKLTLSALIQIITPESADSTSAISRFARTLSIVAVCLGRASGAVTRVSGGTSDAVALVALVAFALEAPVLVDALGIRRTVV